MINEKQRIKNNKIARYNDCEFFCIEILRSWGHTKSKWSIGFELSVYTPPHVFQASWFKPPKPQKWKSCSLDGRITRPPADYTTSLLREKTEERDPGEQKEEDSLAHLLKKQRSLVGSAKTVDHKERK